MGELLDRWREKNPAYADKIAWPDDVILRNIYEKSYAKTRTKEQFAQEYARNEAYAAAHANDIGSRYDPRYISDDPRYMPKPEQRRARGTILPFAEETPGGKVGIGVPGLITEPIEDIYSLGVQARATRGFPSETGLAERAAPVATLFGGAPNVAMANPLERSVARTMFGKGATNEMETARNLRKMQERVERDTPKVQQHLERTMTPEERAQVQVAEAGVRKGMTPKQQEEYAGLRMLQGQIQPEGSKQDVRLIDVGRQDTERLARAAANVSPEAKQQLVDFLKTRDEQQTARAIAWFRGKFNNPRDANLTIEHLKELAESPTSQAYIAAYDEGARGLAVSQNPVLYNYLRYPQMKAILNRAREAFHMNALATHGGTPYSISGPLKTDNDPRFTLAFWDQIMRQMSRRINNLLNTGDREGARPWIAIRNRMMQQLDNEFPLYADARGHAAATFKVQTNIEAGQDLVRGGHSAEWIRDFRDTIMQKDPTGKQWGDVQIGFLHEILYGRHGIERLGLTKDLTKRLNDNIRDKEMFRAVLGPERADEFETFLMVEKMMRRTYDLLGNSTTIQQAADLARYGFVHGPSAQQQALQMAQMGPRRFFLKRLEDRLERKAAEQNRTADLRRAEKIVELLLSKDPKVYYQGIQQLTKDKILQRELSKLGGELDKLERRFRLMALAGGGAAGARQRERQASPIGAYSANPMGIGP